MQVERGGGAPVSSSVAELIHKIWPKEIAAAALEPMVILSPKAVLMKVWRREDRLRLTFSINPAYESYWGHAPSKLYIRRPPATT